MEENITIMSCSPPVKTKRKKKKRTRSSIFYVDNINLDNNDDNIDNIIINNTNSPDSQCDSVSITTTDSNTSTMSSATISSPTSYTTSTNSTEESVATTTSDSLTLNSSSTSLHFTLSINSTSACKTDNITSDIREDNLLIENNNFVNNNFESEKDNVVVQPKLNYVQQLRLKFEKLSFAQQPQDDHQKLLNSNSKTSTPRRSLRKFVRCNSINSANHNVNDSANCNIEADNQSTEKFTWKHFNAIHSRFLKRRSSNIANNIIINNSIPNNTNNNNQLNTNNNVEVPSEEEVDEITTDDIVEVDVRKTSYLETAINELSRNSMAGELTDQLEVKNLSDESFESSKNVLNRTHEKLPSILIDECTTESGSGSGTSGKTNNNSNQNTINTDRANSDSKVIKPKRTKKRNRSANRPKTEIYEAKNYNVHMLKSHSYTEHTLESESSSDEDFDKTKFKSLSNERIRLDFNYDSKDIPPSVEELIRTEERYIKTLKNGIKNYGKIFENTNCPKGLKGKKFDLLGNIDEIIELHENIVLPMLEKNRSNLQKMFEDFIGLIEDNTFYSYVLFTINKRKSSKLCEQFCSYFKELQMEINDNLGIISFLVQPIQRLPRYQLLFNEFLKQSFGNFDYRSAAGVCAKLEKRIGSFINMLNESEEINAIEDCFDLNIFHQGHFKKSNEFQVYDYSCSRYYRSKAFIFEKNLIYTEIKKDRLIYRGSYPYNKIGLISKTDSFTVFYERRKRQECDFKSDPDINQNWIKLITAMTQLFADEEKQRLQEKYSAKMKTNESDIYRKSPSTIIFRNSNRTSADSGISGMATPINTIEEGSPNTTWYDTM